MASKITKQSTVRWSPDQIAAPVGTEVVVMSIARGQYYELKGVAGDIWQRLERPIAVGDLCDRLSETYEADQAQIETEVLAFLNEMLDEAIVTVD